MLLNEFYFSLVFTHFYGIAHKYVCLSRSLASSVVSRESMKKRLNKQAKTLEWVPVTPPPTLLVGLLLSKQPTIFRWRKRHDNILAVKAIVEKPTFLKFVFL